MKKNLALLLFSVAFWITSCYGQDYFPEGCSAIHCPRCFKCVIGEKNYPNCIPPIGNEKCQFNRSDCTNLPCPPDTICEVEAFLGAQCYGKY